MRFLRANSTVNDSLGRFELYKLSHSICTTIWGSQTQASRISTAPDRQRASSNWLRTFFLRHFTISGPSYRHCWMYCIHLAGLCSCRRSRPTTMQSVPMAPKYVITGKMAPLCKVKHIVREAQCSCARFVWRCHVWSLVTLGRRTEGDLEASLATSMSSMHSIERLDSTLNHCKSY
jgi:hypothetical protein